MRTKSKSVSLTFRGFDLDPTDIENILGIRASHTGRRGHPRKPDVKTALNRSFAMFALLLDEKCRLDQAIPLILDHLGGINRFAAAYGLVSPEFF